MIAYEAALYSQSVFRCLLRASASPGEILSLPSSQGSHLEGVGRALLDHEVGFCVVGDEETSVEEGLYRLTNARSAPIGEADFVFVSDRADGVASKLRRGSLERPELGATAVYLVQRLSGGSLTLALSGPGIPGERLLEVEGLPLQEVEAIRDSRSAYPLGVDVYVVDPDGLVASLPRSTRIEVRG